MTELLQRVTGFLDTDLARSAGRALLVLVLGFVVARMISRRLRWHRMSAQQVMLFRRLASSVVLVLSLAWAMRELGFQLGPLLGAAGLLTIAIGFASQTSVSNLVSGLFLMGEQPFKVGDLIKVDDVTGEVLSVDLMSTKIRTFDNQLVRIPNETLLKSKLANLTAFPIRRLDIVMGVAYKEDLNRVREVLLAVADNNPLCMVEPPPLFLMLGFGDSALEFQFSVWTRTESFLELKNSIYEAIKRALEAAKIEIPFPHRTLYAGSATAPFPVQLVPPAAEQEVQR